MGALVLGRRAALVAVVALVALLLPWSASLAGATIAPPEPKPVVIPDKVIDPGGTEIQTKGKPTITGPATVPKPGGRPPVLSVRGGLGAAMNLLFFGQAAYDLTCNQLGVVFHDPGGCDEGEQVILDGLGFGSDGDVRPGTAEITYQRPGVGSVPSYQPGDVVNYTQSTYYKTMGSVVSCYGPGGMAATFWYVVYWDAYTSVRSMPGACGGTATTSTSPWDVGGTLLGYGVSGGQTANALCGGVCSSASKIDWYTGMVSSSTGAATGTGTLLYTWYPPDAEPWTVTYKRHCVTPSGSTFVSEGSTSFTPTPNQPMPGADAPACWEVTPGSHQTDLEVLGGRDTIENPEVTVHMPTYTDTAKTKYPLCTSGAPSSGCWLDLQRDGKSCFGPDTYCAGWTQNKVRWKMTCEWGPYEVSLATCEAEYATKFDTKSQPEPGAQPTPGPGPGTGTIPGTGTNPETAPETGTNPNLPENESANCWGSGWSWNPVSWVYVPIKCALRWAFVPSGTAVEGFVTGVRTRWMESTPGQWVGAVTAALPSASESGCAGPLVEFDVMDSHVSFRPLNACAGAAAATAAVAKTLASVGVVWFGGLAAIRILGAGLGWNPGLGKGGDA